MRVRPDCGQLLLSWLCPIPIYPGLQVMPPQKIALRAPYLFTASASFCLGEIPSFYGGAKRRSARTSLRVFSEDKGLIRA
jgi:hypothetical protein